MAIVPNSVGVGYIEAPFSYLRAMLGEPIYKESYKGHVYKSDVVWQFIICLLWCRCTKKKDDKVLNAIPMLTVEYIANVVPIVFQLC